MNFNRYFIYFYILILILIILVLIFKNNEFYTSRSKSYIAGTCPYRSDCPLTSKSIIEGGRNNSYQFKNILSDNNNIESEKKDDNKTEKKDDNKTETFEFFKKLF